MAFLVKPRLNAINNAMYFPTEKLEGLAEAEYRESLNFYQATFNIFSWMRLNSLMQYRIIYPTGTPFMWQPHLSCAWTPTGTLSMGALEVAPCKAKINEEFCYDEFFGTAFRDFLRWDGTGPVRFTDQGEQAVNMLVRTIVKNATLGAKLVLTAGQLHPANIELQPDTPTRIEDAFRRQAGVCRGWIEMLRDMSQTVGMEHLDGDYLSDPADFSADGKEFTGDFMELYDAAMDGAPAELYNSITEGGVSGVGGEGVQPLFLVSPSVYRRGWAQYRALKESTLVREPRLDVRQYTYGGRAVRVLFVDETPVIPIHDVTYLEKYVVGTSHFAYLTLSGVIQLGGSFTDLPAVNQREVAVMMQVSEDAEDYGMHKFLAHALFATAINDASYITGAYAFVEPA